VSEWVSEWVRQWVRQWVSEWVSDWLIDWLIDWLWCTHTTVTVIYAHKKSVAFLALTVMKLTDAQMCCVQTTCTKFHQNQTSSLGITHVNQFVPLSKLCFRCADFHCHSVNLCVHLHYHSVNLCVHFLLMNFIKIRWKCRRYGYKFMSHP